MVYFIHFCKAFYFVFTNWDVIVFGCRVFCCLFLTFGEILKRNCVHAYIRHACGKKKLARWVFSEHCKNKIQQSGLTHHFGATVS